MRIGILTHGASPFGPTHARAFLRRGHPVEILSVTPCGPAGDVPLRVVETGGFKPWETEARHAYVRAILPVRRAVREGRYDILFAIYMSSAGVLGCLSGHPRVVTSAQGSDVVMHVGSPLWRAVFRWQGRRACLVHAVSDPLAEMLRERVGIPADKIVVCPVGIDTARLPYVDPAARPHAGRILNTRGHKPVYDQATLVRAVARLKVRGVPCHVTFAHAERVETTRQLVREAGIEDVTTFIPGYAADELPALLAAADVYVSSSLSDGTSISLLEAMATGLFPVVSDIPANRPWVEHGCNGLLFPVGDDAALADRLEEALARPDLRAVAAPRGRERVLKDGEAQASADKLLAAFQRCLGG
jgi:glycosyltransferase involved in cell wall biosynthesis